MRAPWILGLVITAILTGCAATDQTVLALTPMSKFAPELAGTPYDAPCGECGMHAGSNGCASSAADAQYIAVGTPVELDSSNQCKRSIEPIHEAVWEDCLRTANVRMTWLNLLRGPAPLPDGEIFQYVHFDDGVVGRAPSKGILESGRAYVIFVPKAPVAGGQWTFNASCPVRTTPHGP
jgi:hypothetical protein